jgi:hypothetical protein
VDVGTNQQCVEAGAAGGQRTAGSGFGSSACRASGSGGRASGAASASSTATGFPAPAPARSSSGSAAGDETAGSCPEAAGECTADRRAAAGSVYSGNQSGFIRR